MKFVVEHGTWETKPPEVDFESCPGKIYVRRNIHKETVTVGDEEIEQWVCEMALMAPEEYSIYSQTMTLIKQQEQDEVLAEILLNQMEV